MDHGLPFCGAGGQHNVLRRSHAGEGQNDLRAFQPGRGAEDLSPVLPDLRPHLPQGGQVQVDWPLAQLAAAGQGQSCLPAAGNQRAHEDHRGAHLLHQAVGDIAAGQAPGVYAHLSVPLLRPAAQMPENAQRRVHIPQLGDVQQLGTCRADHRRRQNGERGVFGALDKAGAFQQLSSPDVP